jgi:hypothetical protein
MAALTAALVALTAAQTVASFAGQQKAARAAEAQGQYEGSILDQNAETSDLEAADAIARGNEASLRLGTDTKQAVGSSRASMAAQGLDLGVGSAAQIPGEIKAAGALDQLTIQNNARREAWGFQVQAQDERNQANLARLGGTNTAKARKYESYNTLLNGATNLYGMYAGSRGNSSASARDIGNATRAGRQFAGSNY